MKEYHRLSPLERAGNLFRTNELSTQLELLREQYIKGRKSVTITACSTKARNELRGLLRLIGKRLPDDGPMKFTLAEFEQALQETGFACALPDLLQAFFPDRPLKTVQEQRAEIAAARSQFSTALQAIADHLPESSRGRQWLLSGKHGHDTLVRRYAQRASDEQEQILTMVERVAQALHRLPSGGSFVRLAVFAQQISNDSHFFDQRTEPGELLLQALSDLAQLSTMSHLLDGEDVHLETKETRDSEAEQEKQISNIFSRTSETRLALYYQAGLLTDTISPTVTVFNLTQAVSSTEIPDALMQQAHERVLVLPLRQLLTWKSLYPMRPKVYLFENPQVFETVVDALQTRKQQRLGEASAILPTLICTSGWLSAAAMRLLDLLTSSSEISLYYSGDFDVNGLRIAAYLLARYQSSCHLWRYDPATYLSYAQRSGGLPLHTQEMKALTKLEPLLGEVVFALQQQGLKVFQEAITHFLIEDIQCSL
jgi:uncharacterized protein (TIGR02679 family)